MKSISAVHHQISGTAAERAAIETSTLQPKDTFLESDTGVEYLWDGDGWVASGSGGAILATDPASAPDGTVANYEDFTLAAAATALFTGQTHTYIDLTVGQHANAGATPQYAIVYLVFNSADPATDLNNSAVRMKLLVQNGVGQTRRKTFSPGALTSCHYKCANTSADLVLFAECK